MSHIGPMGRWFSSGTARHVARDLGIVALLREVLRDEGAKLPAPATDKLVRSQALKQALSEQGAALARSVADQNKPPVLPPMPPLLPPADPWHGSGPTPGWVKAAWERHHRAMKPLEPIRSSIVARYRTGVQRHNHQVDLTQAKLQTLSDGPLARAAARDLGAFVKRIDKPVQVTTKVLNGPVNLALRVTTGGTVGTVASGVAVGMLATHNPALVVAIAVAGGPTLGSVRFIKRSYQAIKQDPNSVRRWIRDLGNGLPRF